MMNAGNNGEENGGKIMAVFSAIVITLTVTTVVLIAKDDSPVVA